MRHVNVMVIAGVAGVMAMAGLVRPAGSQPPAVRSTGMNNTVTGASR
jgi:hypothetical protein